MTENIQPQPSPRPRHVSWEFEDEPEYVLRKPRSGKPTWVWLLLGLGIVPLVCGGLAAVALGFFWYQSPSPPAPMPAFSTPTLQEENDPDLPVNWNADGFEIIAPPTPDPAPDAKDRPPAEPAPPRR